MRVPFNDLNPTTLRVRDAYIEAVRSVLDKGHFILGEEVDAFERQWAEYIGVRHCVGVSNGADALYLALIAAGVAAGDEVITQGNAYNASVTAILRAHAVPRFADICADTLQIDTGKIEQLVNKKTKAILPVHLYGQSGDMGELVKIAKKNNLKIIEDCAQAHGAAFSGKKLGSIGDIGAFSFYPTKNLGAFGDAGAVVTNDEKAAEEIRARRNLGQTAKNDHRYFGTNMRLDPIQAIALSLKLSFFEETTRARQEAGEYYNLIFKQAGLPVEIPATTPSATHVYHLYVIRLPAGNRDAVRAKLSEAGVETAVHYPVPIYRQPFYTGSSDPCPVTDEAAERILSIPMFYGITREQQEYTAEQLARACS